VAWSRAPSSWTSWSTSAHFEAANLRYVPGPSWPDLLCGCPRRRSKVILETAYLTPEQVEAGCRVVVEARGSFVKTVPATHPRGAEAGEIALMRRVVGDHVGVKGRRRRADARRDARDAGGRSVPGRCDRHGRHRRRSARSRRRSGGDGPGFADRCDGRGHAALERGRVSPAAIRKPLTASLGAVVYVILAPASPQRRRTETTWGSEWSSTEFARGARSAVHAAEASWSAAPVPFAVTVAGGAAARTEPPARASSPGRIQPNRNRW